MTASTKELIETNPSDFIDPVVFANGRLRVGISFCQQGLRAGVKGCSCGFRSNYRLADYLHCSLREDGFWWQARILGFWIGKSLLSCKGCTSRRRRRRFIVSVGHDSLTGKEGGS